MRVAFVISRGYVAKYTPIDLRNNDRGREYMSKQGQKSARHESAETNGQISF